MSLIRPCSNSAATVDIRGGIPDGGFALIPPAPKRYVTDVGRYGAKLPEGEEKIGK